MHDGQVELAGVGAGARRTSVAFDNGSGLPVEGQNWREPTNWIIHLDIYG